MKGKGKDMDHESVNIRSTTMSCGVMELSRIDDDVEKVLYQIASSLYHPSRGQPCAFFVWSDISHGTTSSYRLRDKINKENFGSVELSENAENPRTGNIIMVYVWAVRHRRLKAWYRKERVKRMRKVGA